MAHARLTRRSLLRAAGASALALGVGPRVASAATKPKRIIFCVTMHGFFRPNLELVPPGKTSGDAYEFPLDPRALSPILEPLAPWTDRLLVLDGLSMNSAIADYWTALNPHVPGHIHLLTGAPTAEQDQDGAASTASVDQRIAAHIMASRDRPAFGSVEVGFGQGGGIELGAYNWSAPSTSLPYLYEPAALFDLLFDDLGSGNRTGTDTKGLPAWRERLARFASDEHAALLAAKTGASAERLAVHRDLLAALADRFAGLLFYVAFASGIATLLTWLALGDTNAAIERTVTVLVIACPHALGLAIPLTIAVSTSMSARAGILVKSRVALERMRTVDVVLLDKTGTLTLGQHHVTDLASCGVDDNELLRLASAVEAESEHPLARAIVTKATEANAVGHGTDIRSLTGRGVEATVDGAEVAVGGPALLRERGLTEPEELTAHTDDWRARGAAVLHVVSGDTIVGAFALEDVVRPESKAAIDGLRRLGIRSAMITGDAQQVADAVATELGIDEVFAEVLPEDKDRAVADLQERGLKVAMVGDGVNDAPALARADVGLAIGAGTDVAIESAGVVLASSDPRSVLAVIRLSRASYRKMVQNLAWGAGYNIIAIPLAAGVLSSAGLTLSPAVGAILMSASTVVVALNAQLLRRVVLRPDADTPNDQVPESLMTARA